MNRFYVRNLDTGTWAVVRRNALVRRATGDTVCHHDSRREATLCCWGRNGHALYAGRVCATPVESLRSGE